MRNTKKGGLLLKYKEKPDFLFDEFIGNAKKIEYISDGANGIIYKVTVPVGYTSGYSHITPQKFGENVKEIALKLCILKSNDISSFKNEVNIQTDVFQKTIHRAEPICPAILFSTILREGKKREFIQRLSKTDTSFKKHNLPYEHAEITFDELVNNQSISIGIIAMEFESGYERLFDFVNSSKISRERKIEYINYGLFIVLKLAIDTGYSQADFHTANIMIHPTMDFFKKKSGRPVILDFGYARKIPTSSMSKIRSLVKSGDYISALKWICSVKRSDDSILVNPAWSSFYGWVCRDWDLLKNKSNPKSVGKSKINVGETETYIIPKKIAYSTNSQLNVLFKSRERYVKELVDRFNELNRKYPTVYPSLPLSHKIIRSRSFLGLAGGGKKKNRTLKKSKQNISNEN